MNGMKIDLVSVSHKERFISRIHIYIHADVTCTNPEFYSAASWIKDKIILYTE